MVWSTCKQTTSCMFVIFDITLSKHIFNQNSYFIFSNFSIPWIPKSFRYLWTPRLFYEVWKIERICNTIGIIIQDSKWTKDELCCDLWTCLISRTTPQKYYFTHLCEISTFLLFKIFSKMDIKLMNTHEIVNGNEPRIIFMTILLLCPTL